MVQSEVEVVKLHSLFQKFLYRWLESHRFLRFTIEDETSHRSIFINQTTLEVTAFRENRFPKLSIWFKVITPIPKYEFWVNGVSDYSIRPSVRFYGRGKLLSEFRRDSLGTDSSMWYPYVSEIVAQLNESQRFALEMTLRDILTQLDREVEFRERLSHGN